MCIWIDEENNIVQVTAVIYVARDQAAQLDMIEMEYVNERTREDGVIFGGHASMGEILCRLLILLFAIRKSTSMREEASSREGLE